MAIKAQCPSCGKKYHVSDELAGRRGKCKGCGEIIVIPKVGEQTPQPANPSKEKPAAKPMAKEQADGPPIRLRPEAEEVTQETDSEPPPDVQDGIPPRPWEKTVPRGQAKIDAYDVQEDKRRSTTRRSGAYDDLIYNKLPIALVLVGYILPVALAARKLLQQPRPGMAALILLLTAGLLCGVIIPLTFAGLRIASKLMKFSLVNSPGFKTFAAFAVCPIIEWSFIQSYVGFESTADRNDLLSAAAMGLLLGVAASFFILWLLFQLKFVEAAVAWIMAAAGYVAGCAASVALIFAALLAIHTWLPVILNKAGSSPGPTASSSVVAPAVPTVPTDERNATAANLQLIGQKCVAYAARHQHWPTDLNALAMDQTLDTSVVRSPFGHASSGPDYIFRNEAQDNEAPPAAAIVAYDASELEHDQITNVLRGDGSVGQIAKDQLSEALAASDRAVSDYRMAIAQRHADEEAARDRAAEQEKATQLALLKAKYGDRPPPVGWKATPDPATTSAGIRPNEQFAFPLRDANMIYPAQSSNAIAERGQYGKDDPGQFFLYSWDLTNNRYIGRLDRKPYLPEAVLSPNGELIAGQFSGGPGVVPVYDVWSIPADKKVQSLVGPRPDKCTHSAVIGFVGNNEVITLGDTVQVWDIKSGSLIHDIDGSLLRTPNDLTAVSAGGKLVAVMDGNARLTLFDTVNGKVLGDAIVPDDPQSTACVRHDYTAMSFSPDGSELALYLGPAKPRVVVWSVRDSSVAADFSLPDNVATAKAHDGSPMSWLPKGNGWLIEDDAIVDRATGAVLTRVPDDSKPGCSELGPRRVLDDGHVLMCFIANDSFFNTRAIASFPLPAQILAIARKPAPRTNATTQP